MDIFSKEILMWLGPASIFSLIVLYMTFKFVMPKLNGKKPSNNNSNKRLLVFEDLKNHCDLVSSPIKKSVDNLIAEQKELTNVVITHGETLVKVDTNQCHMMDSLKRIEDGIKNK